MEASNIEISDQTPASKKLQSTDAKLLLKDASSLVAMKGKKVTEIDVKSVPGKEAVAAMLGPTGNLRAPTIKVGKKLLVGFNEEIFARELA